MALATSCARCSVRNDATAIVKFVSAAGAAPDGVAGEVAAAVARSARAAAGASTFALAVGDGTAAGCAGAAGGADAPDRGVPRVDHQPMPARTITTAAIAAIGTGRRVGGAGASSMSVRT